MPQLQIKTATRAEDTLSRLRADITRGVLLPGTLLAESAVARQLGVSRVPVREALFSLEREGLVEFSGTGRAYVKELNPRDFEELFLLRLALEPLAVRLAAPAIRKDPSELEENILATAASKTLPDLTILDLDYHEIILRACGQKRLFRIWKSLRSEMEVWLAKMHRDLECRTNVTRETTVNAHTKLMRCMQEQSPAAAEKLCREHIQGWREWLPVSNTQE